MSEKEISDIWVPRILFVNSPKREKSAITLNEPGRETVGEAYYVVSPMDILIQSVLYLNIQPGFPGIVQVLFTLLHMLPITSWDPIIL